MSRKSDKRKPSGKSLIANRVELDRYQMPTKKPSEQPQPDMGKYILYGVIALIALLLLGTIL